jgi:secondary thiamine-phosphate synthase enzyme
MSLHHQEELSVGGTGPGLSDITAQVAGVVARAGVDVGLVTVFVRHTSASLVIQENADPDVQIDLDAFLRRLVPEGDRLYRHTDEGPDDMPAHVKCALTATSMGVPIGRGRMVLGTWQGIYLWEHRARAGRRKVVVHVTGVAR